MPLNAAEKATALLSTSVVRFSSCGSQWDLNFIGQRLKMLKGDAESPYVSHSHTTTLKTKRKSSRHSCRVPLQKRARHKTSDDGEAPAPAPAQTEESHSCEQDSSEIVYTTPFEAGYALMRGLDPGSLCSKACSLDTHT
jgi:hypothetical protein